MIKIRFDRFGLRLPLFTGLLFAALSASAMAQTGASANSIGALKLKAPIFLAAAGAPAAGGGAAAQAPAADVASFFQGTTFSGFVDFYYLYNFNAQAPVIRAFDTTHNSFSLSKAELALENKPTEMKRAGYRIDFDYGPTATAVNGGGSFQNLQQAYLSYLAPVGKGLQFDFGKFLTPIGAEVVDVKDDWNYSRSLLFNFAQPLYHVGLRVGVPVNDQVGLGLFLVNGWNNTTDNNTGKTIGANVAVKASDKLNVAVTGMGGPEQAGNNDNWRTALDAVLNYTISPKLSFMANYDWVHEKEALGVGTGTQAVQGIAGYLKFQVNDMFAIGPRVEYFSDSDGAVTGGAQKLKDVTITADLKSKDGVHLMIEYRRDMSDVNAFVDKNAAPVNHQDSLTFGLVYAFGM